MREEQMAVSNAWSQTVESQLEDKVAIVTGGETHSRNGFRHQLFPRGPADARLTAVLDVFGG